MTHPHTPVPQQTAVPSEPPVRLVARSRNLRADLVREGLLAAYEAVAVIRRAFADGTADFDDAVRALPAVHRVVEHVEKIEAARNTRPALPRVMFHTTGGTISITVANEEDSSAATRLLDEATPPASLTDD